MSQPSDESKEAREAMLSAVLERLSVNMGHMSDGTPMFLRESAKVVRDAAAEREKREQVERALRQLSESLGYLWQKLPMTHELSEPIHKLWSIAQKAALLADSEGGGNV